MSAPSRWSQRYPPLISFFVTMFLVVAVLPSALNLPQANPSTTLEYAPVPPSTEEAAPNTGNLSALDIPASSGAESGPPVEAIRDIVTKNPATKKCVGNPPKQTEDPLSPPCVAFFEGSNGGATYPGVSASEIVVLFYIDSAEYADCTRASADVPARRYYDLAQPPEPEEYNQQCWTRVLRNWMRYFNDRYQTYKRFVHFWVYIAGDSATPETRRADAAEIWKKLRPFATIFQINAYGFFQEYRDAMTRRGVMYYTGGVFSSASDYRRNAPKMWGYYPSLEEQARNYVGYLCKKVVPHPVSFSGNDNRGAKRVYGLIKTTDETRIQLRLMQDEVGRLAPKTCGMKFAATATYPIDGQVLYSGPKSGEYSSYPLAGMSQFQQAGVTTIIWPGGYENEFSKAAARINYRPEWIMAGDIGRSDGYFAQNVQDQEVWSHVFVVSPVARFDGRYSQDCMEAYRSVDPNATTDLTNNDMLYACNIYPSLRQMFTGIQVAGPGLTPDKVDVGYHAVPPYESTSPYRPACFYRPGDYSCVKDAQAMWYDPNARNSLQTNGCYRMVQAGRRSTAETWPAGNVDAQRTPADPCNGFRGDYVASVNPPV